MQFSKDFQQRLFLRLWDSRFDQKDIALDISYETISFSYKTIRGINLRTFQANRDAGIREAECEKAAMDIKYSTGEKVFPQS